MYFTWNYTIAFIPPVLEYHPPMHPVLFQNKKRMQNCIRFRFIIFVPISAQQVLYEYPLLLLMDLEKAYRYQDRHDRFTGIAGSIRGFVGDRIDPARRVVRRSSFDPQ